MSEPIAWRRLSLPIESPQGGQAQRHPPVFPPLPEPRLAGLSGGAGGRRKLFERSEFFRRPLKVGSLGVSTEAGAAFFWFLFLAAQEKELARIFHE